jgi:hypothetical protein
MNFSHHWPVDDQRPISSAGSDQSSRSPDGSRHGRSCGVAAVGRQCADCVLFQKSAHSSNCNLSETSVCNGASAVLKFVVYYASSND